MTSCSKSHDGFELTESTWIKPQDALKRLEKGEMNMIIPTIENIKALAQFSSSKDAFDYFDSLKLEEEVLKLAETIISKSTKVVKIGKSAFYKQLSMPLEEAYKYTSRVMSENMMALDAKEGISAFIEKRKPNWKDK